MQDEVVKHSRKIFYIFKNPNHSFFKKIINVSVEIFIIVFAVTFSIWLHSIKEHSREQKEVRVFLKNVREDLGKDIEWMKKDKESYKLEIEKYNHILQLTPDSFKTNSEVNFSMRSFRNKINSGNYEGFKASGKIGYIENEDLKKAILGFYQQDAPKIIEINDQYNQNLSKTVDILLEYSDKTDAEIYLNPQVKRRIAFLITVSETIIRSYDEIIIKNISEIIGKIDKELEEE